MNKVCSLVNNGENKAILHTKKVNTSMWHRRLGHTCEKILVFVLKILQLNTVDVNKMNVCLDCQLGKYHLKSFPNSNFRAKEPLHTNVWRSAPIVSLEGFKNYVVFVDNFSRFIWVFPFKTISETRCSLAVSSVFGKSTGKEN